MESKIALKCARLILFPAIKNFKISACESFIIDAFLYSEKQNLSKAEIQLYLLKNYQINLIPDIIFNQALNELVKISYLIPEQNGFLIESERKINLKQNSIQFENAYNGMIKSFLNVCNSFRKIDAQENKLIVGIFLNLLSKIIDEMSNDLVVFFHGSKKLSIFSKEEFAEFYKELIPQFHDEKLADIFIQSFKIAFNNPEEEFSLGVFLYAQTRIICDVIGKNIDVENFNKTLVNKISIYIDTNIIVAALCPSSAHHKPIQEVLESTKSLGIHLFLFDITEEEFLNLCTYADELLKNEKFGLLTLREGFNEIIDTYRRVASKYGGFEEFLDELMGEYNNFKRTYDIQIVNTEKLDLQNYVVNITSEIIFEEFKKQGWNISFENIHHDAKALLCIQKLRTKGNEYNYWFLTRHDKLTVPDAKIANIIFSSRFPSIVKIDTWIEAIFPFLTVKNEVEIAKAYTTSIGHSLIPMFSVTDVEDFLSFSFDLIGIEKKDEQYFRKKIERSLNKKLLKQELESGDPLKAFRIVLDSIKQDSTIKTEKEIVEKDLTITHQKKALHVRMDQVERLEKKVNELEKKLDNSSFLITRDNPTLNFINIDNLEFNQQIIDLKNSLIKLYPDEKIIIENLDDIENCDKANKITRLEKIKEWLKANASELSSFALQTINLILEILKKTSNAP